MPRNVEIKAKISDLLSFKESVSLLCCEPCKVIDQHDTFFNVPNGRLKLRVVSNISELIYYERKSGDGPKLCDFVVHQVDNHQSLKEVLKQSYGIRGTVEKRRYLYMYGQTRIHVDEVVGLGSFMELEVVLNDDQTVEDGDKIAHDLMDKLKITELIDVAYIDLLEKPT